MTTTSINFTYQRVSLRPIPIFPIIIRHSSIEHKSIMMWYIWCWKIFENHKKSTNRIKRERDIVKGGVGCYLIRVSRGMENALRAFHCNSFRHLCTFVIYRHTYIILYEPCKAFRDCYLFCKEAFLSALIHSLITLWKNLLFCDTV